MTHARKNTTDVQAKCFVRIVPVKFRLVPRKTLKEAPLVASAVHGSSSRFPDHSDDVPIVEHEMFRGNAACDLHDSTTRAHRESSALQCIPALSWYHSLYLLSSIQAVEILNKDALAAFGSICDGAEFFVQHKRLCDANKTKLHAWFEAREGKLSDAKHCSQKIELTEDTINQFTTTVDEAERALAFFKNG